jgi:hypothetical protein
MCEKCNSKPPQELWAIGGEDELMHGIKALCPQYLPGVSVHHGWNFHLVHSSGVYKHLQQQECRTSASPLVHKIIVASWSLSWQLL